MFFSRKKNTTLSETELLAKYKEQADLNLLGSLYEPYMELIFGICMSYLKDQGKAEDAVMHIFEKLIVQLKTHEVSNFKSWLHSVARNHCLMILRKPKPEFTDVFELPIMDSEENEHQEDDLQALENCIESLKQNQNLAIRYFYKEEKSYAETASLLKVELKKVKSLIQNARRMLKNCLEKSVKA